MSASLEQVETIQLPYGWAPRPTQEPLWNALCGGVKRSVAVWHRKHGKSLFFWNWLIRCAAIEPGLYWHVFPSYAQGKKTVWDGYTNEGRRFLDYIPPQLLLRKREDELSVWIQSRDGFESKIQVVGTDNPDSLRGPNPRGAVFDEFAVQDPIGWDIIRPVLKLNDGWAAFVFTPNGKNHAYVLFEMAKKDPEWFAELLTVKDTGAVTEAEINRERREGMPEELVQQEYYCSFTTALVGTYYGEQLALAEKEGRITKVPYDASLPVTVSWDLGRTDATAIWFWQAHIGGKICAIDYYEAFGQSLDHYAKVLAEKPYAYKLDLLPHDAKQQHMTGKTVQEALQALGRRVQVVKDVGIQSGIQALRALFPRIYFDEEKCADGLTALREYKKKFDQHLREYTDEPAHTWASHGADSARIFAVGHREVRMPRERIRAKGGGTP